jgi:hypothetical protein
MSISTIFLLLILVLIITLYVIRPFFKNRSIHQMNKVPDSLLAERERILTSLQELDFDQALGKIPAEDYPSQRHQFLLEGAKVLRQIDAFLPVPAKIKGEETPNHEPSFQPTVLLSDEDIEELIAKHRTNLAGKSAGFCPKCGKPVLKTDKYCPSCGIPLI